MSVAPARSRARFSILTDAQGLVPQVDVLEANAELDAWRNVAEKAMAGFAGQRRSNPSGRALRTVIEVDSKVQLPSGRSPGTGVSLLNVPLKRRGHKDSPKVALLSLKPHLEMVEVLDPTRSGGATVKLPVLLPQFELLGLNGDLVDLGAAGRQVVHSRVLREEAL
jgi:hypothetical protein